MRVQIVSSVAVKAKSTASRNPALFIFRHNFGDTIEATEKHRDFVREVDQEVGLCGIELGLMPDQNRLSVRLATANLGMGNKAATPKTPQEVVDGLRFPRVTSVDVDTMIEQKSLLGDPAGAPVPRGRSAGFEDVEIDTGHSVASSAGTFQQKLHKKRYRSTGAALLGAALPGGPGDVEMRPAYTLRELGQEAAGRYCAALAAADIREIGKIAL